MSWDKDVPADRRLSFDTALFYSKYTITKPRRHAAADSRETPSLTRATQG